MKICLLTIYLNHFNENKLLFGRTLEKPFLIFFFFFFFLFLYFFCGLGKCELQQKIFINLRLRQILILRPSALFLKNLRFAAGKFAFSAVWGNTFVTPTLQCTNQPNFPESACQNSCESSQKNCKHYQQKETIYIKKLSFKFHHVTES